jgi:hypothetical protein
MQIRLGYVQAGLMERPETGALPDLAASAMWQSCGGQTFIITKAGRNPPPIVILCVYASV